MFLKYVKHKKGLTLVEIIIVSSLLSLVFGLGIYPMLSQIRLINREKRDMSVFDDANLVMFYISRDAMIAKRAEIRPAGNGIDLIMDTNPPTWNGAGDLVSNTVSYVFAGTQLRRNGVAIANSLDPAQPPVFTIGSTANPNNPPLNRLMCTLFLKDGTNPDLVARRDFEVKLRCRDALKF